MLTQSEVAERAGLSMYTVNAAEGGRGISLKTGRALATALGVDPEELLIEPSEGKALAR
jgi:transcriptional regulator with XRE-family HTH domain